MRSHLGKRERFSQLMGEISQRFRAADFEKLGKGGDKSMRVIVNPRQKTKLSHSFLSIPSPGVRSIEFLELGAAPGGFSEFLCNYSEEELGVRTRKGHAITLQNEGRTSSGSAPAMKVPECSGCDFTLQYRDIHELSASDVDCGPVDLLVADCCNRTGSSPLSKAWVTLLKELSLGFSKLRMHGLAVFRLDMEFLGESS